MSTGAEGPYTYSDETAESLGLLDKPSLWDERDDTDPTACTCHDEIDIECPQHGELRAEGDAGDPDIRYDDDSTGTVDDYEDWGDDG